MAGLLQSGKELPEVEQRCLLVTIDTEIDKDFSWRVSKPLSWRSVTEGIPRVFTPLFAKYGVKPTYLLSPEVLEHAGCVKTLAGLGESAELGTHLHGDFIEPERTLFPEAMAGRMANAIQMQYPRDLEFSKMQNLTNLFEQAFGCRPTAFRAGRYGIGPHSFEVLSSLGYLVDSSVTPGLRWRYTEGTLDFRNWAPAPHWVTTAAGKLLELPISIRAGGGLAPWVQELPPPASRVARRLLRGKGSYHWLRPSWGTGADLIQYVQRSHETILTLMLHSMEVIPGASPYAATEAGVERIVNAMDTLFHWCQQRGFVFCSMTEAARYV